MIADNVYRIDGNYDKIIFGDVDKRGKTSNVSKN